MTEQQMWIVIAEAYERYASGESSGRFANCGLCFAINRVLDKHHSCEYDTPAHNKLERLHPIFDSGDSSTGWGAYGRENAAFRATVAGFLAAGMNP